MHHPSFAALVHKLSGSLPALPAVGTPVDCEQIFLRRAGIDGIAHLIRPEQCIVR